MTGYLCALVNQREFPHYFFLTSWREFENSTPHVSEAEKQRAGGKSGKETILTSFVLEQLDLRRANSVMGDSLLKLQADGLVIWLLLKSCV